MSDNNKKFKENCYCCQCQITTSHIIINIKYICQRCGVISDKNKKNK